MPRPHIYLLSIGLAVSGLAACGDEASIGSQNSCFAGVSCSPEQYELVEPTRETMRKRAGPLERLEPAWTLSALDGVSLILPDVEVLPAGFPPSPTALFAFGHDAQLWVLPKYQDTLHVFMLSPDGQLLGQSEIAPPNDQVSFGQTSLAYLSSHPRGPVASLAWFKPCFGPDGTPDVERTCLELEFVAFGDHPSVPPHRFVPHFTPKTGLPFAAFRSADGHSVLTAFDLQWLQAFDLGGGASWQKSLPSSLRESFFPYALTFSPLDTVRIAVAPANLFSSGEPPPYALRWIDMSTDERELTTVPVSGPSGVGDYGDIVRGFPPGLHFDAQDRAWFAQNLPSGDIMVGRVESPEVPENSEGKPVTTARIERDGYVDLKLRTSAMDTQGNLYLATATGVRDGPLLPVLCRVDSVQMDIACVNTSGLIDAMQVNDAGQVFAMSNRGVERYDFPAVSAP